MNLSLYDLAVKLKEDGHIQAKTDGGAYQTLYYHVDKAKDIEVPFVQLGKKKSYYCDVKKDYPGIVKQIKKVLYQDGYSK